MIMDEENGASSRKSQARGRKRCLKHLTGKMPGLRPRNLPHRVGEIARDGGLETQFFAGTRMTKGELPGVEHLARIIAGAFAAVQFVAEDGMAEVMEVHPDLMGPAAVQNAFDQADLVAGTNYSIFGFRGAALASCDAHPLAVHWMAGDRFVDDA
jgi:hypothetical protein